MRMVEARECFDAARKKSLTAPVSTRRVHLAMPNWSNAKLAERTPSAIAGDGTGYVTALPQATAILGLVTIIPVAILGLGLLLIGPGCGQPN
jgi:hypothetical protein